MRRYQNPRQTAIFLLIAIPLMVLADHFFRPVATYYGPASPSVQVKIYEHSEITDFVTGQAITEGRKPEYPALNLDSLHKNIPQPEPIKNNGLEKMIRDPADLVIKENIIKPAPSAIALPPVIKGKGMVVLIIDDMGMDRKRSRQIAELPGPLTLAFLPYAPKLADITEEAREKGHELLIHVPMQPMDDNLDAGPLVLQEKMSEASLQAAMEHSFNSFEGYVGINNHMGSKLTQNRKAMDRVMEILKARKLLFVDSKTIPSSVAADSAAERGVAYAERDIFLDNVNSKEEVLKNLEQLETLAKKRGYAVAIGHPRQATLESLQEWLPTLNKRDLTLVPVSRVVKRPVAEAFGPKVTFGPALTQQP